MLTAVRTNITRWHEWRTRSVNHRILSSTVVVGTLGAGVKVAGWAKLLVIARQFGTGDALDAFLAAFLIPSFLAEVLGASFSAALIPKLTEVREREGRIATQRLFSGVTALASLILCGAGLTAYLLRRGILATVASSFSGAKLATTETMMVAMLPLAVLMGIGAVWRATLNADEQFALAAGTPAITPGLTIILVLAWGRSWGGQILVAGALAGTLVELLVLAAAIRRAGYTLAPRWAPSDGPLGQVMGQYAPMVAGAIVLSGAPLVDQAFAGALGAGAISTLNYGTKLALVFLGVGPVALSTVVLPHFSRMAAMREARAIRQTLWNWTRVVVLCAVPLSVALVLWSEPIVRVAFERGAFTAADTSVVAVVQRCAALQIPFAVMSVLVLRVLSSLKANQWILWGAGVNMAGTFFFDYLFSRSFGVPGIALARAVVSAISLGFLCGAMIRALRRV